MASLHWILFTCALAAFWTSAQTQKVLSADDFLNTCRNASREELEPCIKELINAAGPALEQGIPEFEIPPMSEIKVDYMNFSEFQNENSYFKGEVFNAVIKGLHEVKLNKLKIDFDKHQAEWSASLPYLHASGRYKLDAKVLMVPFKGEGTFWAQMINPTFSGVTKFDLEKIGENYHLRALKSVLDLDFDDASAKFNNLDKNAALIQEAAQAFLKDNAKELVKELLPMMNDQLAARASKMAAYYSRKIPLTKLPGEQFLRKAFNIYD